MQTQIKSGKKNGPIATAAYALFDVGNSAVGAIHATFIFAVYFTTTIAPENGTAYWGYMTSAAALTVALIGPILHHVTIRTCDLETDVPVVGIGLI